MPDQLASRYVEIGIVLLIERHVVKLRERCEGVDAAFAKVCVSCLWFTANRKHRPVHRGCTDASAWLQSRGLQLICLYLPCGVVKAYVPLQEDGQASLDSVTDVPPMQLVLDIDSIKRQGQGPFIGSGSGGRVYTDFAKATSSLLRCSAAPSARAQLKIEDIP